MWTALGVSEQMWSSIGRYRGTINGRALPLGKHDLVQASAAQSHRQKQSKTSLRVAPSSVSADKPPSNIFHGRRLPWTSAVLSAGRASRNELQSQDGPGGKLAPGLSKRDKPKSDWRVGEILIGDVITAIVPAELQASLTPHTRRVTGTVDRLLPDGTFQLLLKPSGQLQRISRNMIVSVEPRAESELLPRLFPFSNADADSQEGAMRDVRSTSSQCRVRCKKTLARNTCIHVKCVFLSRFFFFF